MLFVHLFICLFIFLIGPKVESLNFHKSVSVCGDQEKMKWLALTLVHSESEKEMIAFGSIVAIRNDHRFIFLLIRSFYLSHMFAV